MHWTHIDLWLESFYKGFGALASIHVTNSGMVERWDLKASKACQPKNSPLVSNESVAVLQQETTSVLGLKGCLKWGGGGTHLMTWIPYWMVDLPFEAASISGTVHQLKTMPDVKFPLLETRQVDLQGYIYTCVLPKVSPQLWAFCDLRFAVRNLKRVMNSTLMLGP